MSRPTGAQLLALARTRIGCAYRFGVLVPKDDADYRGDFDCAEFASWLVYQTTGQLYGCAVNSAHIGVSSADAYTGYWARDSRLRGTRITVAEAQRVPGAFLLRAPGERRGHIAVSDGLGGTVEAHSHRRGVCADVATGRAWTTGVLVPGIEYTPVDVGGERDGKALVSVADGLGHDCHARNRGVQGLARRHRPGVGGERRAVPDGCAGDHRPLPCGWAAGDQVMYGHKAQQADQYNIGATVTATNGPVAVADPWAHRSEGMRCRTCMFWVLKLAPPQDSPRGTLGRCRRHAPTLGGFPAVFAVDWCGDHKLDETRIET